MRSSSSATSSASTRASRSGGGFSLTVLDQRPGAIIARVRGSAAQQTFQHEAGGHRWQRVPPTERSGRVHTSTVTVAVLPEPPDAYAGFSLNDVEIEAARGHGKGGQHRNKTESAIRARHRPTGLEAYCQSERSQHQNKAAALAVLRARVFAHLTTSEHGARAEHRRGQVGQGQRGDKRRTIRTQDGQVVDHVAGLRWRLADYLDGRW